MADAAALKAEGNKCLAAKDFDGAIAKYTEAIAIDPSNHVFYSNRSAAYLSKGDPQKALEDAEKCISAKSDWPKGYGRKGAALHALHNYPDAIEAYEAGLKVSPNDAALKKGMASVEKALAAGMQGRGNPFAQLFSPQNVAKLKAHPTTGPLFQDAAFANTVENAATNPAALQLMQNDPRFMQCLQVLLMGSPEMQRAQQEQADEQKRKEDAEVRATPKGYGSWAPSAKEPEPEEEEELTAEQLAAKQKEEEEEAERQKIRAQADEKKDEVR